MFKQKSEISKNVYTAASPLFYLSRIWGVAPLSIHSDGSGYILQWSIKYTIYSFVLGATLFASSIYNLVHGMHGEVTQYVIPIETTVAVQLNVLMGIFGLFYRMPRLFTFLNYIKEIDLAMPMADGISTRKSSILTLIVILGIQTIFMIFDLYMGGISGLASNEKSIANNFLAHYLSYYVILIVVFQFAHMVNAIERRIKNLNTHLSLGLDGITARQSFNPLRIIDNSQGMEWISGRKDTNFPEGYLEEILKVYLRLCDAGNAVNNCYGPTILIVVLSCLVQLTVHLYFVLSSVLNQMDIARITVECMWLLVHFCRLIIVVEPCNKCSVEQKVLQGSVAKLQCAEIGSQYEEQLSLLCAQISRHPIELSAFGLGSIDRSLITSFAGAVATYLVIIIQFENPT